MDFWDSLCSERCHISAILSMVKTSDKAVRYDFCHLHLITELFCKDIWCLLNIMSTRFYKIILPVVTDRIEKSKTRKTLDLFLQVTFVYS